MGGIDESSIDNLSSVCEFCKIIRNKSGSTGGKELQELSPSFLWLLRDFQFQLTADGQQLTTLDYLNEVLTELPGSSEGMRSKNQMRASIKTVFPDRDCFALVRPMTDEAKLAQLDKLPPSELRPEFRKGLEKLVDMVLAKAQPKQYHGQYMTGPALAAFAQAYVDVINRKEVPAIASTWQSVVQSECRRAQDAAVEAYRAAMRSAEAAGVSLDMLDGQHAQALDAAMAVFRTQAVGEPGETEAFAGRVREAAQGHYTSLRKTKAAEADALCSSEVQVATTAVAQKLQSDPPDFDALDTWLRSWLNSYEARTSGPTKYKRAAEFLMGSVVSGLRQAAARAAKRAEEEATQRAAAQRKADQATALVEELRARVSALQAAEAAAKSEAAVQKQVAVGLEAQITAKEQLVDTERQAAAQLRTQLSAREQSLESERGAIAQLRAQLVSSEQGLQGERQALAAARAQAAAAEASLEAERRGAAALRAQLGAAQEGDAKAAAALTAAQARATQLEADLARLRSDLTSAQAQKAAAEASAATASSARGDTARVLSAREAELAARDAELAAARQEVVTLRQQITQVEAQLSELQRTLDERNTTITHLQRAADFAQRQIDEQQRRLSASSPAFGGPPPPAAAPAAATTAAGGGAPATTATGRAPSRKRARTDAGLGEGDGDEGDDEQMQDAQDQDVQEVSLGGGARGGGGASRQRAAARRTTNTTATVPAAATPPAAADGGGGAGAQRTPFSNERSVLRSAGTTPATGGAAAQDDGAGSGAGGGGLCEPSDLGKMSVNDLKAWLTDNGFEGDVFRLNQSKAKRADWMALIKSKCG